jgi:hypothetical protein
MEYIQSRNELNYCMQTLQNLKNLPNHFVDNSRNIKGIVPTFGSFAPFDCQFVDDSLMRVCKRH